MTGRKTLSSAASVGTRGEALRQQVLDAAERLLHQGKAAFSMRDLAAEAGVSFATPFNQFGSKAAILHAVSARRIDMMIRRFGDAPPLPDATARVMLAVDIAAGVMLEEPAINRAVMGWLGTASPLPGHVLEHSAALWQLALDSPEEAGGAAALSEPERLERARQLAFAFRGVLSFWTAGELPDAALAPSARALAAALLRGG